MNDTQEPTKEQQDELIVKALELSGFERVGDMEIYTKAHGKDKVVVDLTARMSTYFNINKQKVTTDDENDTLGKLSKMLIEAKNGQMPAQTKADMQYSKDAPKPHAKEDSSHAKEQGSQAKESESKAPPIPAKQHQPPNEQVELTIDIVKKYINEKVTDEEAYRFIQLCKARHLNPFIGQVHLIKREFTGMAKTVVGKDVFMETATRHPQYDGFEAGIIIKAKGKKTTEDRPGAFLDDDETLVGGWAKVHRKDQKYCTEARVSMKEYSTGKASWKNIPATMIRKVGLVQSLREAFAAELSGMYDSSELGVETE